MASRPQRGLARPGRRDFLIGGTLLAAEAITFARMPWRRVTAMTNGKLDDIVPRQIGDWFDGGAGGLVLPPEQAKANVYTDVLTRTYVHPSGALIMFLIAYDPDQSGMLQIHRPEACYPGSGFTITTPRPVTVPLAPGVQVPALAMTGRNDARVEQVLYWTRIGRAFPRRYDEQRSSVMMQNLRGVQPDGALVRLSIITEDADRALSLMAGFARRLYADGNALCRAMLVGPPGQG